MKREFGRSHKAIWLAIKKKEEKKNDSPQSKYVPHSYGREKKIKNLATESGMNECKLISCAHIHFVV